MTSRLVLLAALGLGCTLLQGQVPKDVPVRSKNVAPATNQQFLADSIAEEVAKNPNKIYEIVRRAISSVHKPEEKVSPLSETAVAAIVVAACSATTQDHVGTIIAAGVSVDPELAATVSKSALSIFPDGMEAAGQAVSETGKRLGNVRVLKITGADVLQINQSGISSPIRKGAFVKQGAKITTGSNGNIFLLFDNESTVQVGPESEFLIERYIQSRFAAQQTDSQPRETEPSQSFTRLSVPMGTIFTNVKKLQQGSTFQVATSVGTMEIKGTGFYVRSLPGGAESSVSFGVSNGQVQFTTATGNSRSVSAGESFGVGSAADGGNFTPAPAGAEGLLDATGAAASQSAESTPSNAFAAAPPPEAAPPDVLANLAPAQQQALQAAALKGEAALVEVSIQLASAAPTSGSDIAAAAAGLIPSSANQIASSIATSLPLQASAIAVAVAVAVPSQASSVASAVAVAVPSQAVALATAVAAVIPTQAPSIAASVSSALPAQAPSVAAAVSVVLPLQAAAIASAVASAVPSQANAILAAVIAAVPSQGDAVSSAVNSVAQSSANNPANVISNTAFTQNPAALDSPSPSPSPAPSPTPVPTATPNITPPPVSPSA